MKSSEVLPTTISNSEVVLSSAIQSLMDIENKRWKFCKGSPTGRCSNLKGALGCVLPCEDLAV